MRIRIILIIVLLGICMPIIAKTVSISGIVTDKEQNPIEYAVVALKNNEDSTMLSSCLTQKEEDLLCLLLIKNQG